MKDIKVIFPLMLPLLIVSLAVFGCQSQDTSEVEEKIAELEEQIENLEAEVAEEEKQQEKEEISPDEEIIEEEETPMVAEVINLTNNKARDKEPSWSPDGTKIIFDSDRDGNAEIYIMNADGSGQVNITNNPEAKDLSSSWSPDGTKIAFRLQANKISEIFIMNADGSEKVNITNNQGARDISPTWSPDGKMIAFESERNNREEIYIINSDDTGLIMLTENPGLDYAPSWSPDGEKIAFVSEKDGNNEIFVINIDGTDQENLTNNLVENSIDPAWSPDGNRIAFTSDREGNNEIYIMNTDGTGIYRLTNNQGNDMYPCWSPDGEMIAFTSDRFGNEDIYVIEVKYAVPYNQDLVISQVDNETIEFTSDLIEISRVEEEGGYIEKDSYVGNGGYLYIGDTERNNMSKGFISFDITGLEGITIDKAVLSFKSRKVLNDPLDLGELIIASHWYGDNPIVMVDYNNTGLMIQSFNKSDFNCGNNILKSELQKAIDELGGDRTRFQVLIYFSSDSSNGNSIADGWEYNQEDIKLGITVLE